VSGYVRLVLGDTPVGGPATVGVVDSGTGLWWNGFGRSMTVKVGGCSLTRR
jgi:hypothetical protein